MLKRAYRLPPNLRHAIIGRLQAATGNHNLVKLGQYGVALHASARTDGLRNRLYQWSMFLQPIATEAVAVDVVAFF